jgi:hypothetical protein
MSIEQTLREALQDAMCELEARCAFGAADACKRALDAAAVTNKPLYKHPEDSPTYEAMRTRLAGVPAEPPVALITPEMMTEAAQKVGFDPVPGRLTRLAGVLNAMLAAPAPVAEPKLQSAKRYALNPDNGFMYESERGPWVRYAALAAAPQPAEPVEALLRNVRMAVTKQCMNPSAGNIKACYAADAALLAAFSAAALAAPAAEPNDDQINTIWHLKVGTPATLAVRLFARALLAAVRSAQQGLKSGDAPASHPVPGD